MSWDDSDEDEWAMEPQPEAKKKDEELTIDDIEEMEKKKKEAEAAAIAAKQPKKKEKKEKEEEKKPEDVPYDVALEDPVAEKLRRQKLVEEADARMAADLFAGIDDAPEKTSKKEEEAAMKAKAEAEAKAKKAAKKAEIQVHDTFDDVELKGQADVEDLVGQCVDKINDAKAKSAAQLFLTHLVKTLEPTLSSEELTNLEKQITDIVKGKKVERVASQTEKKAETKVNKNTKFDVNKAFAESKYGNDDWDEDWDDEEWWDDGTAAAYAPPKK